MKEFIRKVSGQFAEAVFPTSEQRARKAALNHLESTDRMLAAYKTDLVRERSLRASAQRQKLFTVSGIYVKATGPGQVSCWKNEVPEIDTVRDSISAVAQKISAGTPPETLKDEMRVIGEQTSVIAANMRKAWKPLEKPELQNPFAK
jgi:hypothetical protein